MKVGFIGLGAMGLPMAKNVLSGGHELFTVVHKRTEPGKELERLGAVVCATSEEVARKSEVVITVLPADAELKEVVLGAHGVAKGLEKGKVLIEMTTATSMTMAEVAKVLERGGIEVLDAPVSGGTPKAASGELTIIVGGDAKVLERWRPLLETMGTAIYHVGGVGAGKVVKMVNQLMAAVHLAIIGEAFTLGVKSGADPATMAKVIRDSSGYSRMLDLRLESFILADTFVPGFKLDLMKKDVDLAVDASRALNVPLELGTAVAKMLGSASSAGMGDQDFSIAAKYLADRAGVKLSGGARS